MPIFPTGPLGTPFCHESGQLRIKGKYVSIYNAAGKEKGAQVVLISGKKVHRSHPARAGTSLTALCAGRFESNQEQDLPSQHPYPQSCYQG